jgi:hypothetical protein
MLWNGGMFLENRPTYLYSSNAGNAVSNGNNPYKGKSINDIFSKFLKQGIEELPIYLLSTLFMMSGFLLFIYGLFIGHLYQFVMSFVFLILGFILDSVRESGTAGQ